MNRNIINLVRNSRFHAFIAGIVDRFQFEGFTVSYAQGGEDLILRKLLGYKGEGLYADIGCNNPIQKSNTYKLYLKGWRGICVDGNADLVKHFKKIRPRDICLNEVVSDSSKTMTFYQFDDNHEMSTIDAGRQDNMPAGAKAPKKVEYLSKTLEQIFDTYANGHKIDLLCVDVEDHDLEVLKGNNYSKYRPTIICAEQHGALSYVTACPITLFLTSQGYEIAAFCGDNIYFRDTKQP